MFAIPIRDIYSHNDIKPRMFDVVIDADGDIFVVTKNGNDKHILLQSEMTTTTVSFLDVQHYSFEREEK